MFTQNGKFYKVLQGRGKLLGISKVVNASVVLAPTVRYVFILKAREGRWCLSVTLFLEESPSAIHTVIST